jgi:hypothetical protein
VLVPTTSSLSSSLKLVTLFLYLPLLAHIEGKEKTERALGDRGRYINIIHQHYNSIEIIRDMVGAIKGARWVRRICQYYIPTSL